MIIKKIEIQNFRSYYQDNTFELSDGLNLIIGSNGDGKTTFYEALEWLFRTDNTNKMDTKFISKKRSEELMPNESDDVRVAMTYEHKGMTKKLEKSFRFTKSFDEEISTSNYAFNLIEGNGIERLEKNGMLFDNDLHADMRKFIMFKGETDLDVLQSSNALKLLIDSFSDVRDFDAYFGFMEIATKNAEQARDNAQKNDRKNADKIKQLNRTINQEKALLADIEREIKDKGDEAVNFEGLLKNIEKSREASKLLTAVNRRIDNLKTKRSEAASRIKEDYTKYLLDDMWILMGFTDVADDYSTLINSLMSERKKQEDHYLVTEGVERAIKAAERGFTSLPAHIPGRKIMEDMLNQEKCFFCGQDAKKGTEAWAFMHDRLEEYKLSLAGNANEGIEPYYQNNYIGEIQKRDTILNDNLADITRIRRVIQEAIAFNNRLHDDVKKIEANLEIEYEQKKRILAQADGLTEDQLLANYENISNWMDKKTRAENRIDMLKRQREQHRATLEDAQLSLSKTSEGTTAAMYARTAFVMQQISNAFRNAKEENKKRLLSAIEDKSNDFMEKLNTNDFKGTIRIIEKQNGQGEAFLMNNDSVRIFNPNTALKTTYLMSVLFAIGKLSSERDNTELPLIFDAPTSSFTDAKENEFFNVIAELDKQVIIVTKSFLRDSNNGDVVLDGNRVNSIKGRVFRIEKKKPFDDKKLGTIQTTIKRIK